MVWEYSEKTKQLFMDAVQGKSSAHLGEIENPDGVGEHGSITCGDALRFSFRVERHPEDPLKDVIVEARYQTFGCTSAIAASEALCALIEAGQYTPLEALKIRNDDIVKYLEGLPKQKIHCSVMGAESLEAAVFDWAERRGVDLSEFGIETRAEDEQEGRMVCECFSLSEPYIRRKIEELELKTIPEITDAIKAGGACATCHHTPGGLQDLLDETWGKPTTPSCEVPADGADDGEAAQPELSPYQMAKQVERVVDDFVRPLLQQDGGDLEIIDIKDDLVYCKLAGACASCPGSSQTIKVAVERTLKERVDERLRVIQV